MSSGGLRIGAGRKKGSLDKKPRKVTKKSDKAKIQELLKLGAKAKARMYQDFLLRISQGEKLSIAEKKMMVGLGEELAKDLTPEEKPADGTTDDLEAADYLRKVWNDTSIDPALRIRAAEIFVRGDGEKKGKKEEKSDKAKTAGEGKFASMANRLRVVK